MSIVNFSLAAGRVVIVTDTAMFDRSSGAAFGFMGKALYLPHVHCAIAAQGSPAALFAIYGAMMTGHYPAGLDDLAQAMPAMLSEAFESGAVCPDGENVFLFGYSQSRGRMAAAVYTVGGAKSMADPITGAPAVPAGDVHFGWAGDGTCILPSTQPRRNGNSPRVLVEAIKEQQELLRRHLGHEGCGGDIIQIDMTRHQAEIRRAGRIAGYERLAAEIGAALKVEQP